MSYIREVIEKIRDLVGKRRQGPKQIDTERAKQFGYEEGGIQDSGSEDDQDTHADYTPIDDRFDWNEQGDINKKKPDDETKA